MKKKEKEKKIQAQQFIVIGLFLVIGIASGIVMGRYVGKIWSYDGVSGKSVLLTVLLLAGMYIGMFGQMIIHEAGHFVFGLLSGYGFCSFRIGSFMWVKEKEKIRLKRMTLAGTGGQCLMTPPEMKDGKIPCVLYNMGGSLANIIVGLLFVGCSYLCRNIPFFEAVFLIMAIVGFGFGLINGIPLCTNLINNDGSNALSLRKNKEAQRAFWIQLKVNEQMTNGMRLKDMPQEWFEFPDQEKIENSLIAAIGVLSCNRLMDEKQER